MSDDMEITLPDMVDISAEAVQQAEASLDPSVPPPSYARKDTDKKTGDEIFRWNDNLLIEHTERKRAKSGLTVFYVRAKIRPNGEAENKSVGKKINCNYRINFKVVAGTEDNEGHKIMNHLSTRSLLSLLKATGFAPKDSAGGLPVSLLAALFPLESDAFVSPLVGKVAVGNVVNRPNKQATEERYKRQTEVESWLPAPTELS